MSDLGVDWDEAQLLVMSDLGVDWDEAQLLVMTGMRLNCL